ncbi:SpoIIE family protein phosphatase [Streptomyces sp. NPDC003077]|uniref:SpoIIE family protein phosphatase n=1 Tax=Streptomyces sp. NPDC003077 TaxID=3154443 RepID=UPI0033B02037
MTERDGRPPGGGHPSGPRPPGEPRPGQPAPGTPRPGRWDGGAPRQGDRPSPDRPPHGPERRPIPLQERLVLNRMGTFDWDLVRGVMELDAGALEVFDVTEDEFDGSPLSLSSRVEPEDGQRLDSALSRALHEELPTYASYFLVHRRDGSAQWSHTQGRVLRDEHGRPYRVVGIVREAAAELTDSPVPRGVREDRERRTVLVQQTTAELSRALSVEDVTQVLTGIGGARRFGADALILGLSDHLTFQVIAATGLPAEPPDEVMRAPIDPTYPLSDAVLTRRPFFATSRDELLDRYPRLRPHASCLPAGAAAVLPLVAQDRVVGALGLFHNKPRAPSVDNRNLALALAGVVAQSLQRAMLFDQEREFARQLQETMLPRRVASVAGGRVAVRYHAARTGRDIGGDWYDVIPLPQGRIGLVIGDVQGHDTHAAAVMGQLRIALRAYATEGHTPETVLVRASRFLAELDTERFATCTYVQADLECGALYVARAGHLGPMISDGDGRYDWPATRGGLPLGLASSFGHDHFPETQLFLEPGSTLLLCTDGLVERPGEDISVGIKALTTAVQNGPADVDALADELSDDLWARSGSDDDMALLLLRRSPCPGENGQPRLRLRVHQADPAGAAEVRSALRRTLDQWRAGEVAYDIEVAATELITNALTHTESGALVCMELMDCTPRRIRLEVEDRSSELPQVRAPGETATSGRGLLLVQALSSDWGAEPRGAGKALWCEFEVPDNGE